MDDLLTMLTFVGILALVWVIVLLPALLMHVLEWLDYRERKWRKRGDT